MVAIGDETVRYFIIAIYIDTEVMILEKAIDIKRLLTLSGFNTDEKSCDCFKSSVEAMANNQTALKNTAITSNNQGTSHVLYKQLPNDVISPSNKNSEITNNSKEAVNGYFTVSKIV